MTTPLEQLPDEVKVLISQHLGITDLSSLVLTSTAMSEVANQELHQRTAANPQAQLLSARWIQYADKKEQLNRLVSEQLSYLQAELGTMQQRVDALVAGCAELNWPRPDEEGDGDGH